MFDPSPARFRSADVLLFSDTLPREALPAAILFLRYLKGYNSRNKKQTNYQQNMLFPLPRPDPDTQHFILFKPC